MKKLKLYLDTSVISHLDAPDTPDKTAETLAFWEILKTGKYEVVISDVVMDEIRRSFGQCADCSGSEDSQCDKQLSRNIHCFTQYVN